MDESKSLFEKSIKNGNGLCAYMGGELKRMIWAKTIIAKYSWGNSKNTGGKISTWSFGRTLKVFLVSLQETIEPSFVLIFFFLAKSFSENLRICFVLILFFWPKVFLRICFVLILFFVAKVFLSSAFVLIFFFWTKSFSEKWKAKQNQVSFSYPHFVPEIFTFNSYCVLRPKEIIKTLNDK